MVDPGTQQSLREALLNLAKETGRATVSLAETQELARRYSTGTDLRRSQRQVEMAALEAGLVPARYRKNIGTVGCEGQILLLKAAAAVVGLGGLGGWVVEGLARMGVGHLVLIDGDAFAEDNLNRQLGCTEATLAQPKVGVLAERVAAVNGAVTVVSRATFLGPENAAELLGGVNVVVDALDTLPARFALHDAAGRLGLPVVHGAIAGYTGQIMTIFPGDPGLSALYGDPARAPERGVEVDTGNPAATPMMIASWQTQEVVKLITGRGQPLRRRMLIVDMEYGETTELDLS